MTNPNALRAKSASARALDRDKIVATRVVARAGRGNRAGNVVALDLAVRQGFGEFVGAAIGSCRGGAGYRAGGEASIDAIAVAVIGNNKQTRLSLRGRSSQDRGGDSHGCD